jgi:hypothetical protein
MAEVETLLEGKGCSYFRTSCRCMGDDVCDFSVVVDDDSAEDGYHDIYLEVSLKSSHNAIVWDDPRWSRFPRSMWRRIKACFKLLTTGYLEYEASFMFRGDAQMDEFVETIQKARARCKAVRSEKDGK